MLTQNATQPRSVAIIVLTFATAAIHFGLAAVFRDRFSILFVLNGIGYIALLDAMYLNLAFLEPYRALARYTLIGFTLVTIIGYFATHPGLTILSDPLGLIDKLIEIALIILLVLDVRDNR